MCRPKSPKSINSKTYTPLAEEAKFGNVRNLKHHHSQNLLLGKGQCFADSGGGGRECPPSFAHPSIVGQAPSACPGHHDVGEELRHPRGVLQHCRQAAVVLLVPQFHSRSARRGGEDNPKTHQPTKPTKPTNCQPATPPPPTKNKQKSEPTQTSKPQTSPKQVPHQS